MQPIEIDKIVKRFGNLDQISPIDLAEYLRWRISRDSDDVISWRDINHAVVELQHMTGYSLEQLLRNIPMLVRYHNIHGKVSTTEVVRAINNYLEEEKDDRVAVRILESPINHLLLFSPEFLRNIRGLNRFPQLLNHIPSQYRPVEQRRNSRDNIPVVQRRNSRDNIPVVQRRNSFEGSSCNICMEDYENGDELAKLPCGHKFHLNCSTSWINTRRSCPVCRRATNNSEITRQIFQNQVVTPSVQRRNSLQRRNSFEEASCTICLDELNNGEPIVKLSCNHKFHENCAYSWLDKNNTCPMCRKIIINQE